MSGTTIVAYLSLFAVVGFLFVFASLLLGRFLRPRAPTPQRLEPYECGEPTVGSSFVQFDLRFYVVALVFLIFDVEVAFFFPWAAVFGKATQLTAPRPAKVAGDAGAATLTPWAAAKLQELGVRSPSLPDPTQPVEQNTRRLDAGSRKLALAAMVDLGVFFAVLMVGFAYVWFRGDLDWVRATGG